MNLEDFFSANSKERLAIYRHFDILAAEYFENSSERTKILAELLVLKRTVNTLTRMFAARDEALPMIFAASMERIWGYLSGKCAETDFAVFSEAFTAYYDWLNDYYDPRVLKQYPAFVARYQCEEIYSFITKHSLIALAEDIEEVCSEIAAHTPSLRGIGSDYLLNELAEMAAFAEKIDIGHPEYYRCHELDTREEHLCGTGSFENVMQCFCEDFGRAITADTNDIDGLTALWREYENRIFFSEEQLAWLCRYFLY